MQNGYQNSPHLKSLFLSIKLLIDNTTIGPTRTHFEIKCVYCYFFEFLLKLDLEVLN